MADAAASGGTRRVHVVGCHRSGTTLMMELLWSCFEFSGRCEHEMTVFEPTPAGETLYLSKKPPDTKRLERVFLADESLYVVAMLRDPRAVVASRHPSRPDVYFSGFARWRDYHRALRALGEHPRLVIVRYETLIAQPDAVQMQLAARWPFLVPRAAFSDYPHGVDPPDAARDSLRGLRALDAARVDGWREHLPRVAGQLAAHPDLAAALIEVGYETDTQWTRCLQGVEAHHQTYQERRPHVLKRAETALRYWWKTRRYLARLQTGGNALAEVVRRS